MAEGPVAAALPLVAMSSMAPVTVIPAALTEEEKHQIGECERILRFRDEVLSGAHPRIKVPGHLFSSKQSSGSHSPVSSSTAAPAGPSWSVDNAPKGPKSLSRKARAKAKKAAQPLPATNGPQVATNLRSFNANAQQSAAATNPMSAMNFDPSLGISSNISAIPTGPKAQRLGDTSSNAQFDPVLLTKSEDLIKAELHLQRQRLERAAADQLQQIRAATKASHATEPEPELDLAEVLIKALQRVQSSAPQQTYSNLAANASDAERDSGSDNDTFYSSKHDTPESHLTHRIPEPDDVEVEVVAESAQAGDESPYEPPMDMEASPVPGQPPVVASPYTVAHVDTTQHQQPRDGRALAANPYQRNMITTYAGDEAGMAQRAVGVPMEIISSQDSEEATSSKDSGVAGRAQPSDRQRLQSVTQQLFEQGFRGRQAPILRAHNLSPIHPQPQAHVSPLAIAHEPSVAHQDAPLAQATPAQVAILRNDRSNGSSPDSSPQNKPNRKGKNKKKRKADRIAANHAASPYIKPEPRSPSPLTAPQFPRPNKRMRQGQAPEQEQGHHEPRTEEIVESAHPSSYPPRFYRDDRGPNYGSPLGQHVRQDPRPVVLAEAPRFASEYRDDSRPIETIRYVRRASPGAHPYPYAPSEMRTLRSVSRAGVDGPHPAYDAREPPRAVIRPASDLGRSRSPIVIEERPPSAMAPPPLPAPRVVVDEYGREYIDPNPRPEPVFIRRSVAPRPLYADREDYYDPGRTTTRVIRRSVAPAASVHGEPETFYERAPPSRAASAMPGSGRFEEELVYRRPASPAGYTTTRRMVARPDYAPEYRYYRERDHPTQPTIKPVGDYYEVRSTHDPRPSMGEPPREYIRSTTVRPDVAHQRSDEVRMSSVRPEPGPGEYGAPIPLDDRQAMPPPRPYSVRPVGPPHPQQPQYVRWPEYETRPVYGERDMREDGGVTYADNAPRNVYR